jgi:hypothetical protein
LTEASIKFMLKAQRWQCWTAKRRAPRWQCRTAKRRASWKGWHLKRQFRRQANIRQATSQHLTGDEPTSYRRQANIRQSGITGALSATKKKQSGNILHAEIRGAVCHIPWQRPARDWPCPTRVARVGVCCKVKRLRRERNWSLKMGRGCQPYT